MTDGTIKGSGNSRYLRTVANALTLYPNYESFIAALIQGTFPIDLNGINSSGWSTLGTRLNKASLLTDALCTALGLSTSATPTQAMDKLRQLIATAQSTANGRPQAAIVSYTGTGTSGKDNPCSITFPFAPIMVMFLAQATNVPGPRVGWITLTEVNDGYTGGRNGMKSVLVSSVLSTDYKKSIAFGYSPYANEMDLWAKKSADGKTFFWTSTQRKEAATTPEMASGDAGAQMNVSGASYYFLGIG